MTSLHGLSIAQFNQGKTDQAEKLLLHIIGRTRQGKDHPICRALDELGAID
jgi:hypothetical protein